MVRITGQRRPDRGTIGRSSANRDYRMSSGLQGHQAAHRRIRNAVASGLDVPGQAALEARILRDCYDHVVPAMEPLKRQRALGTLARVDHACDLLAGVCVEQSYAGISLARI